MIAYTDGSYKQDFKGGVGGGGGGGGGGYLLLANTLYSAIYQESVILLAGIKHIWRYPHVHMCVVYLSHVMCI